MSFWSDLLGVVGTVGGALIGGPAGAVIGGSIGGGISGAIGNSEARSREDAQIEQNIALQREFAQHGIRWRVEDAKAAGLHPLAALGASGASYSPSISVGQGQTPVDYAGMGQNIGRAMESMQSKDEKAEKLENLTLERADLENQLLRSQIASQVAQIGPGLPSRSGLPGSLTGAGQGDAYVLEKALERTHSAKGKPSQEVGHITDLGFAMTKDGVLVPVPSKDVKERIEDNFIAETAWALRNNLMPNIGYGDKPSKELLPKGYSDFQWDYKRQGWRPVKPGKVRKKETSADYGYNYKLP